MSRTGLLFDLDGVLVDSREVWFELLNAAAAEFGQAALSREVFEASFGQGVEADAEQFFGGMEPAVLGAWFDAHFLDQPASLVVEPGAQALFQALEQRGVATAIVTNSSTALAAEVVRGAGLQPEVLVGSSDVARPKPAPDGIALACQRLGVSPEGAWMVGDSRFDRDAALAAGVGFIGYRCAGELRVERLSELLFLEAPFRYDSRRSRTEGGAP